MYSAMKNLFDNITEQMQPVTVIHALPQAVAVTPCITYYIEKREPVVYADNKTYMFNTVVILDIWEKRLSEAEKLCNKLQTLMESMGYTVSSEEKNTKNAFSSDVKAEKRLRCSIVN